MRGESVGLTGETQKGSPLGNFVSVDILAPLLLILIACWLGLLESMTDTKVPADVFAPLLGKVWNGRAGLPGLVMAVAHA